MLEPIESTLFTPPEQPKKPLQPFTSADFYAGSIEMLEYLSKVANGTTGAEVWASLFSTTKLNLINEAKTKGFEII